VSNRSQELNEEGQFIAQQTLGVGWLKARQQKSLIVHSSSHEPISD